MVIHIRTSNVWTRRNGVKQLIQKIDPVKILVGIILATGACFFLVYASTAVFDTVVGVLVVGCAIETSLMTTQDVKKRYPVAVLAVVASLGLYILVVWKYSTYPKHIANIDKATIITANLFLFTIAALSMRSWNAWCKREKRRGVLKPKIPLAFKDLTSLFTPLWTGWFLSTLAMLREDAQDKEWVFFLLLTVYLGDAGGNIVGIRYINVSLKT